MHKVRRLCFLLMVCTALASCARQDEQKSTAESGLRKGEGFVDVPGGRVWYRIEGSGTATPLLLVHGGPGASSVYLNPMKALAVDRPVIFYDQLGGGRSERPKDLSLWTMKRFVDELEAVRRALGLNEMHLYGSSFGTMVVADYLQRQPRGIKSVIFASPALSIPRWAADAKILLATLPPPLQRDIDKNERAGTPQAPEYQAATMEYYRRYGIRRQPWPDDVNKMFAELNQDIYVYMQGPSEFTITGTLKDYDATPTLGRITAPTLFISGEYDGARPETMRYYQSLVPGSRLEIIPDAAHLTMQDQPEKYNEAIRAFLRQVEGK
jgi:proline-specific peptidase